MVLLGQNCLELCRLRVHSKFRRTEVIGESLPIANFREEIINSVVANLITIIVAETGAGKSTQVPRFLLEEGYDVIVTQPRRLAAFSVAERVAEEVGCDLGTLVGFRTARERQDRKDTRCLYVTDGLALIQELMQKKVQSSLQVLVLDEVHEWNLNIEVLVAWVKSKIADGVDFKLVLMSATLEADKLVEHFPGSVKIFVPGRTFPIEEQKPAETIEEDVSRLVNEGRNVLVFQPGKAEIEATIEKLIELRVEADIFPLHGDLVHSEQQKCFAHYERPKVIVATNIAQTSITIDDIDAVVDSGMERRIELVSGVEGLYIRPVSLSDSKQRAGRSGRTKAGIYIDHCPGKERLEFPVAEIMRVHLDQTVLRLAQVGCDMEKLSFFHQPPLDQISAARKSLQRLGCMDSEGEVTRLGRRVARLPVSVKYGRMLIEAIDLGVAGDLITIAAIFETGVLHARKDEDGNPTQKWKSLVRTEQESDVMAQLRLYEVAETFSSHLLHRQGIHPGAYRKAKELREHLKEVLVSLGIDVSSTNDRSNILLAVRSGMADNLYRFHGGMLVGKDRREQCRDSIVDLEEWAVGVPFDLEVPFRDGKKTLSLVNMLTTTTLEQFARSAPQLVEVQTGLRPRYDHKKGVVVSTTETSLNGSVIAAEEVLDTNHPEAELIRSEK